MSKDLTNSILHRQNILNNPYALREIEKATQIAGIPFEGKTVVLKEQVAVFFEVSLRTVENYLSQFEEELVRNGYEVINGKRLKTLKGAIEEMDGPEIYFGTIARTSQLGIFDFRAFLNLAMLMVESERARLLRQGVFSERALNAAICRRCGTQTRSGRLLTWSPNNTGWSAGGIDGRKSTARTISVV